MSKLGSVYRLAHSRTDGGLAGRSEGCERTGEIANTMTHDCVYTRCTLTGDRKTEDLVKLCMTHSLYLHTSQNED